MIVSVCGSVSRGRGSYLVTYDDQTGEVAVKTDTKVRVTSHRESEPSVSEVLAEDGVPKVKPEAWNPSPDAECYSDLPRLTVEFA